MAQLMRTLIPPPSEQQQPGRVSQLLPTVKCSSCNEPVPLSSLGEHVCAGPAQKSSAPPPQQAPRQPAPPGPTMRTTPRMQSPLARSPLGRSPSPELRIPPANNVPPPAAARPRPSLDSRPSFDSRPSYDRRPSLDDRSSGRPSIDSRGTPSPANVPQHIPPPHVQQPHQQQHPRRGMQSPAPGPMIPAQGANLQFAGSQPPNPQFLNLSSPTPPPETVVGGVAGMAGVGRRAFAAAAHAAMFAHQHHQQRPHNLQQGPLAPQPRPALGTLQARRANEPQFLDTTPRASTADRHTPPLSSPNSPYSSSHSSESPLSLSHGHPLEVAPPAIAPSRTPSPPQRDTTPVHSKPLSDSDSTPSPGLAKLPFFEKYKQAAKPPPIETQTTKSSAMLDALSPTGSDSELAYTSWKDDEPSSKSATTKPLVVRDRSQSTSSQTKSRRSEEDAIVFPSTSTSPPSTKPLPRLALKTSVTSASSYSSRSGSKSVGALDRAMEALFEDDESMPGSPTSPPTRSKTQPTLSSAKKDERTTKRRAEKKCVKCHKLITDGRWIQTDKDAGILCERDWKMMYLPKCRRCDKPIEGQAVGSSDGQLKGKYHRQCFNCTTCHKPFPDKSFYVFEGKPFCDYHYHEANNSLCASLRCGRPIEGPCALAHNGDRYHPEHLTCEHDSCGERLEDYWEIDGIKLCDRHAKVKVGVTVSSGDGDVKRGSGGRAQKRITRFVDLAQYPSGGI